MQHTITLQSAALVVEIEAEVHGRYIPASWEHPEEHPEVEILSVVVVEDEDETGQFTVGQDVLDLIDRDTYDDLAVEILDYESDRAAAAAEDYYDGLREDALIGNEW